jgi:hypothetical protein
MAADAVAEVVLTSRTLARRIVLRPGICPGLCAPPPDALLKSGGAAVATGGSRAAEMRHQATVPSAVGPPVGRGVGAREAGSVTAQVEQADADAVGAALSRAELWRHCQRHRANWAHAYAVYSRYRHSVRSTFLLPSAHLRKAARSHQGRAACLAQVHIRAPKQGTAALSSF